jgi:hypothetical protein
MGKEIRVMSRPSMIKLVGQLGLAIAAAVLLTGCPPELSPGTDCWATQAGSEQPIKVPGNFFGPASDPVDTVVALEGYTTDPAWVTHVGTPYSSGGCGCPDAVEYELVWVDKHGDPTTNTKHAVKQEPKGAGATNVDTCIYRAATTEWNGENVAIEVEIKLLGLSLKSVSPIEVTYHETTDPIPSKTEYYNLYVTHSAVQPDGKMSFNPSQLSCDLAKGAVNLGALPVNWDAKFVQADAGGTEITGGNVVSLTDQPLEFSGTVGNFELTD